jgi:NAD(P) transhydrogenase subunit alpha
MPDLMPLIQAVEGAAGTARDNLGPMIVGLYVFVLATLAGREVIGKVPPTLHTPLMSGANAISGIAIVGALVITSMADTPAVRILGIVAIAMATVNVVGGFMVTDRMLEMFKKK